jgi:alkylhydroperoxidase family enzyme
VGLDEAQLEEIVHADRPDAALSEIEQVVVEYSRRLTRLEPIDDELYAALQRHFTRNEMMELCFTIGVSAIINRFHATFHTPLDERTRVQFEHGSPIPFPERPRGASA